MRSMMWSSCPNKSSAGSVRDMTLTSMANWMQFVQIVLYCLYHANRNNICMCTYHAWMHCLDLYSICKAVWGHPKITRHGIWWNSNFTGRRACLESNNHAVMYIINFHKICYNSLQLEAAPLHQDHSLDCHTQDQPHSNKQLVRFPPWAYIDCWCIGAHAII